MLGHPNLHDRDLGAVKKYVFLLPALQLSNADETIS